VCRSVVRDEKGRRMDERGVGTQDVGTCAVETRQWRKNENLIFECFINPSDILLAIYYLDQLQACTGAVGGTG